MVEGMELRRGLKPQSEAIKRCVALKVRLVAVGVFRSMLLVAECSNGL